MLDALVLVLSVLVLLVPELRVEPLRFALFALVLAGGALTVYRLRAAGMLKLTPKGILHARSRPRFSLLSHVSTLVSIPAMIVLVLS